MDIIKQIVAYLLCSLKKKLSKKYLHFGQTALTTNLEVILNLQFGSEEQKNRLSREEQGFRDLVSQYRFLH